MTPSNFLLRLAYLQPLAPLLMGQITADLGSGMVLVLQPGGGVQQVRNPAGLAVGQWVFFKDRVITGEAPSGPFVRIEI